MMNHTFEDFQYKEGDEVTVLINGLGATPLEELYIINRKVHKILGKKGIRVFKTYVGEFATAMEMTGMSISLLKMDDELKKLITAPCLSPFFEQQ